ncbi:MAG: argininosuccinate lyase [Acidobacteria bacterium]|nr:argininosuccinate lyase [Acidobacteriota bacterium]
MAADQDVTFDPHYIDHVLHEHFEDAKALFLSPLMAIHYAHLVMLADRRIVSAADARLLRDALDAVSASDLRSAPYDGTCEDLFFYVERLLVEACGEDVAGRLHTARSRNDIDMTMYRLRQRESLLAVFAAALALREGLIDLADRHRNTLFAAHTHTQPAQPSTIAHYLLGVIEQLERDAVRLQAAFASTNRSPLGSCAITGTGFPIDRQLTSDLLGFDGPTGNTYGSIATVDYLLESVSATAVLLTGLGRFVQDLLLWCTVEFGYLRLAEGFVQASSIMPQKRNPVALEHARAIASKALGQAAGIVVSVHNTPFGDVVDTEDDLQPLVASMFRDALRALTLVDAAMRSAEFDVARLEARAAEGGTTSTELADHLVRQHDVPFRTAHAIAARVLQARRQRPDAPLGAILATVSGDLIGVPLQYTDAQIADVLSARHFVEMRRTLGGPAPSETTSALAQSRQALECDRQWLAAARGRIAAAEARLRERALAL